MAVTLEQVRRRIETKRDDAELKHFADKLFAKANPEFMQVFDADGLIAMSVAGLRRFKHLTEDVSVNVYNPTYQADGWEAPYTVLEVHLKDRPFIVDSVRAELKRQGYELYHLLHPILNAKRNDEGELLSFGEGELEAYELYFLEREDDT